METETETMGSLESRPSTGPVSGTHKGLESSSGCIHPQTGQIRTHVSGISRWEVQAFANSFAEQPQAKNRIRVPAEQPSRPPGWNPGCAWCS